MAKLNFFTVAPTKSPESLAILIYGRSGAGKTTIAASYARDANGGAVLIADTDKGLRSVEHMNQEVGENRVRAVDVTSVFDLEELLKLLALPEDKQPEELRGVRTLVIDSISTLRDLTMAEIRKAEAVRGKRADQYQTQLQDYNRALAILDTVLAGLKNLNINLILLAEERTSGIEGLITERMPELNPRLQQAVLHKMDHIWAAKAIGSSYALKVLPSEDKDQEYLIKNRGPRFVQALQDMSDVSENGWFIIPTYNFATLPHLQEIYIKSFEENN